MLIDISYASVQVSCLFSFPNSFFFPFLLLYLSVRAMELTLLLSFFFFFFFFFQNGALPLKKFFMRGSKHNLALAINITQRTSDFRLSRRTSVQLEHLGWLGTNFQLPWMQRGGYLRAKQRPHLPVEELELVEWAEWRMQTGFVDNATSLMFSARGTLQHGHSRTGQDQLLPE